MRKSPLSKHSAVAFQLEACRPILFLPVPRFSPLDSRLENVPSRGTSNPLARHSVRAERPKRDFTHIHLLALVIDLSKAGSLGGITGTVSEVD